MRYHWLAHHLVQEKFPQLNEQTRNEIISEAVCRAWCSFLALDYRLMQTCVDAAAKRKGVLAPQPAKVTPIAPTLPAQQGTSLPRGHVIHLADYR